MIGTVAIPNMDRGGHARPLFPGSIAAGGTLGNLFPPSINMILHAVLTDTSVTQLDAAGFIPGFLLAGLLSLMVLGVCLPRPELAGPQAATATLWRERVAGLVHLLPPLGLFLIVVGSIHAGITTPTEAAALRLMATVGLIKAVTDLVLGSFMETLSMMIATCAAARCGHRAPASRPS